jgi:hypothetical protein
MERNRSSDRCRDHRSVALFLLIVGPAFCNILWPVIALKETFVPYRHVFLNFPFPLKLFVLPQGYWTTTQPLSSTMRSGFGGFIAKPFSLFGLTGLIRSTAAASVAVFGKNQSCELQTWTVAGTSSLLALVFRPYCTRLTLTISIISSALTVTLIILNQFSGVDSALERLSLVSSVVTFSGTVLLLIVKVLTNRWKAAEEKAVAEAAASGIGSDNAFTEIMMSAVGPDRNSTSFSSGDTLLTTPLLVAPSTDRDQVDDADLSQMLSSAKPLRQEKKQSTMASSTGFNPLND